jgi:nucleoside-triphosphatase THEP1
MGWNWKGELTVQVSFDSPDSLLASFVSGKESGQLIIVTGPSGSGKTNWCLDLAEAASTRGISTCGLVSPAVFEGGIKVSIDLRDLKTGATRQLAVQRNNFGKGQVTEDWIINIETLDWGNAILAHLQTCQLFILDELGPLELERGVGLTNGISLVAARRYQMTCVVIRPSLLAKALVSWPWGKVHYIPSKNRARVETP